MSWRVLRERTPWTPPQRPAQRLMSRDRLRPASSGSGDVPEFGLSKRRREIIRRLESAYAEDDLSLEDYEHRVLVAERAMRIAELNALIADFPDDIGDGHPARASLSKARRRSGLHPAVWLVPAALLLLALLSLPYGFYVLLRLVVCGTAALLTYDEYRLRGEVSGWAMVLAGVALLFNPLVPVHLTREIWAPIDIGTAFLMVVHWRWRA